MAQRSFRISPEGAADTPPHLFPEPGEFMIFSRAFFHIQRDQEEELVECAARMRVGVTSPTDTAGGARQVSLTPTEWEAVGKSRLLGGELKYALLQGAESRVEGGSVAADLPGRMVVTGRFATFLNEQKVDEHDARAVGVISSFPPEGDLFDISGSSINIGNISVRGVVCKCESSDL